MTGQPGDWGPFATGLDGHERIARRRELRALAVVLCGLGHPLTRALNARTPDALAQALAVIDGLPALTRRKLLSTYILLRD